MYFNLEAIHVRVLLKHTFTFFKKALFIKKPLCSWIINKVFFCRETLIIQCKSSQGLSREKINNEMKIYKIKKKIPVLCFLYPSTGLLSIPFWFSVLGFINGQYFVQNVLGIINGPYFVKNVLGFINGPYFVQNVFGFINGPYFLCRMF